MTTMNRMNRFFFGPEKDATTTIAPPSSPMIPTMNDGDVVDQNHSKKESLDESTQLQTASVTQEEDVEILDRSFAEEKNENKEAASSDVGREVDDRVSIVQCLTPTARQINTLQNTTSDVPLDAQAIEGAHPKFQAKVVGSRIDVLCQLDCGTTERFGGRIAEFHCVEEEKEDGTMAVSWYHVVVFDDGTRAQFDLDARWEKGIVWIEGYPDYAAAVAVSLPEVPTITPQRKETRGRKRLSSDDWEITAVNRPDPEIIEVGRSDSEVLEVERPGSEVIEIERPEHLPKATSSSSNTSRPSRKKKKPQKTSPTAQAPTAQKSWIVDKRGAALIGKRCQILFNLVDSDSKEWFWGTIAGFNKEDSFWYYHIIYDDGETEWLELRKGGFRIFE